MESEKSVYHDKEIDSTNIDEFGQFTVDMWFSAPEDDIKSLAIMTLGLAGETGEVVEPIKKFIRDGTVPDNEMLKKELGDCFYYLCRICKYFGYYPSEVLKANIEKLKSRNERGVLRGSGNDR